MRTASKTKELHILRSNFFLFLRFHCVVCIPVRCLCTMWLTENDLIPCSLLVSSSCGEYGKKPCESGAWKERQEQGVTLADRFAGHSKWRVCLRATLVETSGSQLQYADVQTLPLQPRNSTVKPMIDSSSSQWSQCSLHYLTNEWLLLWLGWRWQEYKSIF